jgi:hypothetical protein
MVRPFLVPFRRLLRLAGSRWGYSTPPPHGLKVHLSIYLSIYGSTALCWTLAAFQFLDLLHGRTPWTGDEPAAWRLPTHMTTKTQNKRTQTSIPQVEIESTIPVCERAETNHALDALDRAVTVLCAYLLNTLFMP